MTHDDLVKKACIWLGGPGRCTVVGSEFTSWGCAESPDAIGWDYLGRCVVVECKTSRSDFFADAKKPYRSKVCGLGATRYYLAPQGLLKPEELPEGWGLIEVKPSGGTVKRKDSKVWAERNMTGEIVILTQIARSIRLPDFAKKHNLRTKIKHWVNPD